MQNHLHGNGRRFRNIKKVSPQSRHAVCDQGAGVVSRRYSNRKVRTSRRRLSGQLDRLAGAGSADAGHGWDGMQVELVEGRASSDDQGSAFWCALCIGGAVSLAAEREERKGKVRERPTRWGASPMVPDITGIVPAAAVTLFRQSQIVCSFMDMMGSYIGCVS